MAVIAAPSPRRSLYAATPSELRRRMVDRAATVLISLCALLGVAILAIILGYVTWRGAPALNVDFFTQRPLPYGEAGGRVFPAIAGTLTMLAIASTIAIPLGLGTAIYLSE